MKDERKSVVYLCDEFVWLRVTNANVSRYVPSGRFHESHMPAKANGVVPPSAQSDLEHPLDSLPFLSLLGSLQRSSEQVIEITGLFLNAGNLIIELRDGLTFLRPLVEAAGWHQATSLRKRLPPHLAIGEPVRFSIDRGELLEFNFSLREPRHDPPTHHHKFTLTCLSVAADDRLHTVRCDVVVGARKDDVLEIAVDVEVLGYLLLVEVAVVATAHLLSTVKHDVVGTKENTPFNH
jgi:hypothetical protein